MPATEPDPLGSLNGSKGFTCPTLPSLSCPLVKLDAVVFHACFNKVAACLSLRLLPLSLSFSDYLAFSLSAAERKDNNLNDFHLKMALARSGSPGPVSQVRLARSGSRTWLAI